MSREPQGDLDTLLQALPAISLQRRLARCIPYLDFEQGKPPRYRAAGESGWNLAIFVQSLARPDRVEILGSAGEALEILP